MTSQMHEAAGNASATEPEARLERLIERFQSLALKTGRSKTGSFSVSVGKTMECGWQAELGGYDIHDWPRHVYVGPFSTFVEMLDGLEAKIAEAVALVQAGEPELHLAPGADDEAAAGAV
ncbi:hypothetical protein F6X40_34570 [Paraburkholderia sp. UCT31]|uniref:hypothetical protein n=1 Tax=Paraburkholderia sp. UCT31 TaxID=2615209 RepID=UPI001655F1F1|nr:hypothetical protein [Paraburkholderia sp. UCT31]MBC8741688.1 hypothetical protein [Paraburkholderia sp. UCT31]